MKMIQKIVAETNKGCSILDQRLVWSRSSNKSENLCAFVSKAWSMGQFVKT